MSEIIFEFDYKKEKMIIYTIRLIRNVVHVSFYETVRLIRDRFVMPCMFATRNGPVLIPVYGFVFASVFFMRLIFEM